MEADTREVKMSNQELITAQGGQVLEIRYQSCATVYAEIPAQAAADAPFIHAWIRNQESARTQEAYAANITRFYREAGKPLAAVTLFDLQDYKESLYDLAPASQVLLLRCVKSAMSFCYQTGHLKANVGAALRLGKPEEKLAERILSEAQVIKMIALEPEPRNHLLLLVLYKAGLRAAEACALQKRNLQENGDGGQVTIYGKGSKTRSILLPVEVWQQLAEHTAGYSPDAYVFQSRQTKSTAGRQTNGRLDESQIHRIVEAAAIRANIETYSDVIKRGRRAGETVTRSRVSPHWLRHAHGSHAIARGADLALVRDTLGHASIEATGRYVHARPNTSSSLFLPDVV
jgi:integrase/recombinase XerD